MRYLYKSESISIPQRLLFIPLKETIIFPYVVAPLFFQSDEALAVLNKVLLENSLIGCVGLRDPSLKDPQPKDLLSVGTVCKILQLVKLPNKGMKILVEGLSRVFLLDITREAPYFKADVSEISEQQERTVLSETLVQSIGALFKISLSMGKPLPEEILKTLDKIDQPGRLADLIAITLHLGFKEQQEIFETIDPMERLKKVFHHFNREIQSSPTRPHPLLNPGKEGGKFLKDHSFRPPQRGLREAPEEDPYLAEIHELREKVRNAEMPQQVEEIAYKEINRLERMNPVSAEYTVSRTYLDYLITMPWKKKTVDNLDLGRAQVILNEDHYDLEKVKERILEFLAVKKLKEPMKGPILCFVGPPGVGKTSLGRSIARALERSTAWVSVRSGIIGELSEAVREKIFAGQFPLYSYMYTLRQFMRLNGVTQQEIEEFVQAVSGKQMSTRDIERLAHGYFKGSEEFRHQLRSGNLCWGLSRMKETVAELSCCTEAEKRMLTDLQIVGKYMQRVILGCEDPRLKTNSFYSQANLLAAAIVRKLQSFSQAMREFHDRSGQAEGHLVPS